MQKKSKLIIALKNNVRYIALFFFSFILLLIAQQYKADDKLPSKELGIVKALNKTSPSEFEIKQSCLSLATSIPT